MHGWLEEDKEAPYFLSNCRGVSEAPLQHKTTVDDPPPREQIKTFNTLTNEDRAVKFLEKLIHAIGMETSQPGIGALKNADAVNSDCI